MIDIEIILSKDELLNLADNIIFLEQNGHNVKIVYSEDVCNFVENDFILFDRQMKKLYEFECKTSEVLCNLLNMDLLPVIEENQNDCFFKKLCEENFLKDNKLLKKCNEKVCRLFKIQIKYACKYKIQKMLTKSELNQEDVMNIISSGTIMKKLINT